MSNRFDEALNQAKNVDKRGGFNVGKFPVLKIAIFIMVASIITKCVWPLSDEERAKLKQAEMVKAEQEADRLAKTKKKKSREDDSFRALSFLKRSLRDPDSFVMENFLANDDASLICIVYRAKNGFGGYQRSIATFDKMTFINDQSKCIKAINSKAVYQVIGY